MSNTMQIANEIRNQLGAAAFVMMGATNLVGDARALQFKIRGSKVTNIRIELAADDTYTVAFWKIRGAKMQKIDETEMVYADQLRPIIERATGLYLSF